MDALGLLLEAVSVYLQTGGSLDSATWDLVYAVAEHVIEHDDPCTNGIWGLDRCLGTFVGTGLRQHVPDPHAARGLAKLPSSGRRSLSRTSPPAMRPPRSCALRPADPVPAACSHAGPPSVTAHVRPRHLRCLASA